jgi:hypothetical protein
MTSVEPRPRSAADHLARQLLRIDGLEPRALVSLKGSLLLSAVRCVLTYAVVPAAASIVGWLGVLATPLSLLLVVVAAVMAVNSLRRVWLAEWEHRWAYSAFIAVVLTILSVVIVIDVRTLLG